MCEEKDLNYYETAPLETLKQEEIDRLIEYAIELTEETRLCSRPGREVVHEFRFKGDLKSVRDQLIRVIMRYRTSPFTEETRKEVLHGIHNSSENYIVKHSEGYRGMLQNAMIKGEFTKVGDILDKMGKLELELHKKKECICYTNMENTDGES